MKALATPSILSTMTTARQSRGRSFVVMRNTADALEKMTAGA
jgi:hypothetical protein